MKIFKNVYEGSYFDHGVSIGKILSWADGKTLEIYLRVSFPISSEFVGDIPWFMQRGKVRKAFVLMVASHKWMPYFRAYCRTYLEAI